MMSASTHSPSQRRACRLVPSNTNPTLSYTRRALGLNANTVSSIRCIPTVSNACPSTSRVASVPSPRP